MDAFHTRNGGGVTGEWMYFIHVMELGGVTEEWMYFIHVMEVALQGNGCISYT